MELTKRQTELFKIIVEEYIRTVQPISSKEIIENFFKDYSSATIRNEMVILEKNGLLEKTHTSSGRVPSLAGYKYYEKNILSPLITTDIETKLKNIFNARDLSIDSIIDQSVAIINEAIKLPIVVTKSDGEAILKRFDLIQIANDTALILIVTSNGNITKNTFKVNNPKQLDDISTCVRVLNDRLIDTPLSEVPSKLDAIQGIIRKSVHEYESCIRQIIEKIFDIKKINSVTSVSGTHYLTAQPEFREIDKLNQVLEFLENSNVWKHISYVKEVTGKTSITFGKEIGLSQLSIASTTINTSDNSTRELSIVGPVRMNYSMVKGILNFIKEEMEKYGR